MNPEIRNGRSRRCRGSGRQHGSADRGEARKSAGVARAGHASKGLPTNLGSLLASTETRGEKGQPDKQRARATRAEGTSRTGGGRDKRRRTQTTACHPRYEPSEGNEARPDGQQVTEHLGSTDENGEPNPMGPGGGKRDAGKRRNRGGERWQRHRTPDPSARD